LLVKFASSPASTDEQVNHASALLTGKVSVVTGEAESALWDEQIRSPWRVQEDPPYTDLPTVIRLSWLPSKLVDVLGLVRGHSFTGRAMGAGLVRLEGDSSTHAAFVEQLRASGIARNVVVLQAPPAVKAEVDVWGPPVSAVSATRALKQMFDPAGILSAGRGPL
jgi:hypothetical protein